MKISEMGLVLEGGGMRGIYTAGVLDAFMNRDIYFDYVIGVSAGACQSISYGSKQEGRSRKTILDYVQDPRYISKRNLIFKGSLLGMDFIFDDIPNIYEPFDYDAFFEDDSTYIAVITDCATGLPVYKNLKEIKEKKYLADIVRASSSLPFLTPMTYLDGKPYIDGGMADSIPVAKAMKDGYEKNIVVLTKPKGYRKKPNSLAWLAKKMYNDFPKLQEVILNRYEMYNKTMELVESLEEKGQIIVIRPSQDLKVSRMEKSREKLAKLFDLGYSDGAEFLNKNPF